MNPERWLRVQELFEAARELTAEHRSSFLAAECVADPTLGVEVQSLLSAYDAAPTFLDAPAAELLADSNSDPDDAALDHLQPLLGTRLGPYRIERELGAGGMGTLVLIK